MKSKPFIVVYIGSGLTMAEDSNRAMVELIERHQPSFWDLMNPDGYIVYFVSSTAAKKRAEALVREARELFACDDRFSQFCVGIAEGELTAEFDWLGRVTCSPLGGAVTVAMRRATQDRTQRPADSGLPEQTSP